MKQHLIRWSTVGLLSLLSWSKGVLAEEVTINQTLHSLMDSVTTTTKVIQPENNPWTEAKIKHLVTQLVQDQHLSTTAVVNQVFSQMSAEQVGPLSATVAAAILKAHSQITTSLLTEVIKAVITPLTPEQAQQFAVGIAETVATLAPQMAAKIAAITTKQVPAAAVQIAVTLSKVNPQQFPLGIKK